MANDLRLYGLLSGASWLVRRSARRNRAVRKLLQRTPIVLEFRTGPRKGCHLVLENARLRCRRGLHPSPDFVQEWRSARSAFRVLSANSESALMRSFERSECAMSGQFLAAMWFNELMKNVRA